jgi:small subunit ribosomal protein S17
MAENKGKPTGAKGSPKPAPAKDTKTKSMPPKAAAAAKPAQKAASKGGPASKRSAPASSKAGRAAAPAEAPAAAPIQPSEARKEHGFRRKILGVVVGDKMDKTVVVEVIRKAMNPMYKKYVRVKNKYKAHDEHNVYKVGDRVEIMEHRPISKHKRWLVTRLVSRPVEA